MNRSAGGSVKPSNTVIASSIAPSAPDLSDLDRIVYPHDFPTTDPQKSTKLLPGTKPTFDRTSKPSLSFMEGGLRAVKIPDDTMMKFLDVVRPNTLRNVETCGILAGQLKYHQLLVTHVILPKQNGTSDSCNTMNEEEIFDIQDQLNLITLGWIHTHPSQTAFLSSVDLHTQAGYQIMMPEVKKIVKLSLVINYTQLPFLRQSRLSVRRSTTSRDSLLSHQVDSSSFRSAHRQDFIRIRAINSWKQCILSSCLR